jgi:hypothetical protein
VDLSFNMNDNNRGQRATSPFGPIDDYIGINEEELDKILEKIFSNNSREEIEKIIDKFIQGGN